MAINTNRRPTMLRARGGSVTSPSGRAPRQLEERAEQQEQDAAAPAGPTQPRTNQGPIPNIITAGDVMKSRAERNKKDPLDLRAGGGGGGGGDDVSKLAELKRQQAAERAAAAEDARVRRQKALSDIDARAGIGGLGLSGATGAIKGDVDGQMGRDETLMLADLDRKQRDEQFDFLQDQIALADFEIADGVDYDGDGEIGQGGDAAPDAPGSALTDEAKRFSGSFGDGYFADDGETVIGGMTQEEVSNLPDVPVDFDSAGSEWEPLGYAEDSEGNIVPLYRNSTTGEVRRWSDGAVSEAAPAEG